MESILDTVFNTLDCITLGFYALEVIVQQALDAYA